MNTFSVMSPQAVWEGESYSEQKLAVEALKVLHHMGNYTFFIGILEG